MSQNIERSIRDLREMDTLASGDSPLHRVSAGAKLLVTVVYILVVVSFDKFNMSGLMSMVLYPAVLFAVSGIPVSTCFYKLRFVLPIVCAVGIFNPILDRVLCLMASFLLMATTRIEALCGALRKIHVPSMLVTLLLLTYRYAAVLAEEAAVMTQAYSLRAPGQKGIHYSAWGSFLGQLLLRSMDRAQELYASMLLRGYRGDFYYAQGRRSTGRDVLYAVLWCALFAAARAVNLTQLLGALLV